MLQVAKQGDLISSAKSEKREFRLRDLCRGPLGVTQNTWAEGWQSHKDSVPGGGGRRAGILYQGVGNLVYSVLMRAPSSYTMSFPQVHSVLYCFRIHGI